MSLSPDAVLHRLEELLAWCDTLFAAAQTRWGEAMVCGKGCCSCCLLESVSPLEAALLRRYITDHPLHGSAGTVGLCPLLTVEGRCRVYPVRPLICRTHGLLIHSGGDDLFHA